MKRLAIFLLIFSSWLAHSSDECASYFLESSQQIQAYRKPNQTLIPLSANDIQIRSDQALQVIRPYLSDRVENVFWIVQYLQHIMAESNSHVNAVLSKFSISPEAQVLELFSKALDKLTENLEAIQSYKPTKGGYWPFTRASHMDADLKGFAQAAIQAKADSEYLKQKLLETLRTTTEDLLEIRNAREILKSDLAFLDSVFLKMHQIPNLDARELAQVTRALVEKLNSLRTQLGLIDALIMAFEGRMRLAQSEVNRMSMTIDITYNAVSMMHKKHFQALTQPNTENARLEAEDKTEEVTASIRIQEFVALNKGDAYLSNLQNLLKSTTKQSMPWADSILLLKNMPRKLGWGWKNSKARQDGMYALHLMNAYEIGSWKPSGFEPIDYHLAMGILYSTRLKDLTLNQKQELMIEFRKIFESSLVHENLKPEYISNVITLAGRILSE